MSESSIGDVRMIVEREAETLEQAVAGPYAAANVALEGLRTKLDRLVEIGQEAAELVGDLPQEGREAVAMLSRGVSSTEGSHNVITDAIGNSGRSEAEDTLRELQKATGYGRSALEDLTVFEGPLNDLQAAAVAFDKAARTVAVPALIGRQRAGAAQRHSAAGAEATRAFAAQLHLKST